MRKTAVAEATTERPSYTTPAKVARAPRADRTATYALIDELAVLAADLWFAGRLDDFPSHEETEDGDDP
ncbi:MAG: hypothetical protein U0263_31445 [Polyangiaceae bacterium]